MSERDLIKRLVEWQQYMGGFDAQVWRDAESFLESHHLESCGCMCFECRTGTHCMATL